MQLHGDVRTTYPPEGVYDDGWSNGALRVKVDPVRDVYGFFVEGLIPDWWPPDCTMSVEANGSVIFEQAVVPGTFRMHCQAFLPAEQTSVIVVRTSVTAYDPNRDRSLGAYVSGIIFADATPPVPFVCNVCGAQVPGYDPDPDPEGSLCPQCGANIRLRKLAQLLGDLLFGKTMALGDFPQAAGISGLGISDSPAFAKHVQRALPGYKNMQFDAQLVTNEAAFLDIKRPNPKLAATADFVTCSEVLEHVAPPVQEAFAGLYSLLRPGGTLILTVPWTHEGTVEHFPDLYEWRIKHAADKRILINHTANGETQEFTDLRFHGGGDDVLEMRVFGLRELTSHLHAAGFTDIRVRSENVPRYGILLRYNWGLPITAKRPIGS